MASSPRDDNRVVALQGVNDQTGEIQPVKIDNATGYVLAKVVGTTNTSSIDLRQNALHDDNNATSMLAGVVFIEGEGDNEYSANFDLHLSGQYLSITDANQTGLNVTTKMTFEGWVKIETLPSDAGVNCTLASKFDSTGNKRSFIFYLSSVNDKISLYVSDDGSSDDGHALIYNSITAFQASNVNQWVHIAASLDVPSETFTFYFNGVKETGVKYAGTTMGDSLYDTDSPFILGMYYTGSTPSNFLVGRLDEFRVWNIVRDEDVIIRDMTRILLGTTEGLQGYWRFENTFNDQTLNNNDLTNNNDVTFVADTPFPNRNRLCLDLESTSSQYLSITDAAQTGLDIEGTISAEGWVKLGSTTNNMPFVSKGLVGSDRVNYGIDFGTDAAHLRFWYYSSSWQLAVATSNIKTGVWAHIAFSFTYGTGATAVFYVNGVALSTVWTVGNGNQAAVTNNDPFWIGYTDSAGGIYLEGELDEVRMWSDVRTATEIQQNRFRMLEGTEENIVGYWQFEYNFDDKTANGNDLTNNNTATLQSDVPFTGTNIACTDLERSSGQSWSIPDANQVGLDLTTALTFEMWIKLESLPSDYSPTGYFYLIDKASDGVDMSYSFKIYGGDNLILTASDDGSTSSGHSIIVTSSTLFSSSDIGVWVYLAVTLDVGTETCYMYKDGVKETPVKIGSIGASLHDSAVDFSIGRLKTTTDTFDGLIDEVRVWNVVRTEAQIQGWNQRQIESPITGLVGYWQFNNNGQDTFGPNNLTNNNSATFSTNVPFWGTIEDATAVPMIDNRTVNDHGGALWITKE